MEKRKILVVDTSVLLYDKESIHSFPGNEVIIPITVLDELDRFKDKPGILGESARYVNRFLDFLRQKGRLHEGIMIEEENQIIRVLTQEPKIEVLDETRGDNKIIAAALYLQREWKNNKVKVITKDINLRVKCDALGLEAEDYYKDYLDVIEDDKVSEKIQITDLEIDRLYDDGSISAKDYSLHENSYHILIGNTPSKSVLCIHSSNKFFKLSDNQKNEQTDVKPRNKEQRYALHALRSENIPLVCLTGLAGSGKTFLTLMSGLEEMLAGKYERIIVTRNIEPVGRDIGYLPGDLNEKMGPWMSPLVDNFRHHFKDKAYFEVLMEKGKIEIAPLSFIRGRTFNDAYIIVDEAQNATIHELKTVVTRIGEGSKIVLMGDTDQIDTPYIDKRSNGLSIVIDRTKDSNLATHIHLSRGERSALATYASKVL
jgi:PhoH-like ATPase